MLESSSEQQVTNRLQRAGSGGFLIGELWKFGNLFEKHDSVLVSYFL